MINSSSCFFFLLPLFFFSSNTHFCYGADAISSGQALFPNQTLVSKVEETFELGFFIKDNSPNVYVGIWYRKLSLRGRTVVWVANRDDPLIPDGPSGDLSSSELKLLDNGNLVLLNQSKRPIWSTNSTSTGTNSSKLVLGDDGNLVLRNGPNPSDVFWQSFDHPTDTWLPGGKLGYDNITKTHIQLISWKNSEDPARGMFSVQIDPIQKLYMILWNRSKPYWTSGPWDGQIFSLVPEMRLNSLYNFSYVSNENESYFTYDYPRSDKSLVFRYVINSSGQIMGYSWLKGIGIGTWNLFWSQPRRQCEVYAFCGTYGTCDEGGLPYCQCLPGFKPRSSKDWNLSVYSGGCVRTTTLHCGDNVGFQLMSNMNLPGVDAVSLPARSDEECKLACLNNCNCSAYSYPNACSIWNGDLLNLKKLTLGDSQGRDLYLRRLAVELDRAKDEKKRAKPYIIISVAVVGTIILSVSACILCRMKVKSRGRTLKSNIRKSPQSYLFKDQTREREGQELPFFDFSIIASCTNNFANKLGEGGFGSVYKGKLLDGQDIAVKRLSRSSGQGIEEFRNELKLISKLQHRNLVRLVGYCIEDEEKILIYEYMPNKSLDAFLFDPIKRSMLDWDKRFNIIDGIARGLLYLHRDSRLRIIHRDLKVSNILLDEDLNPKISDFGMARIFGGNQASANTNRVVGTYGYMSPEYAMGGIISEKSDVFSFGVLLLEILSSRRNTSFYYHEKFLNLLGYAWALWNEGKALELIDPKLVDESSTLVLMRCIHVGLLCVQEHADDRPTMPTVVFMIGNETILPSPKQPAFILESTNLQSEIGSVSVNNVTITLVGGR